MTGKMRTVFLFAVFFLAFQFAFSPPPALAEDADIPYGWRMPYRIIRGITNFGLSWTEIILRPFGEAATETIGESIGHGALNALYRTNLGILDVTTFWVPDIQMLDLYPDWEGWPYLFQWS